MALDLKGQLVPGKVVVFVDNREAPSGITGYLQQKAIVKELNLECGDFVCSERVAVERKTVMDFIASIKDQRLFQQMERLLASFERPVLLIEGSQDKLFYENGMHGNSIRGALSSIAVDYRVPIIWTGNARESAEQIFWMANREQVLGSHELSIRPGAKKPGIKEAQEFIIAGLPGISNVRARKLLEHFKSPAAVFTSTEKELSEAPGVGKKTAKAIRAVLDTGYAQPEAKDEE